MLMRYNEFSGLAHSMLIRHLYQIESRNQVRDIDLRFCINPQRFGYGPLFQHQSGNILYLDIYFSGKAGYGYPDMIPGRIGRNAHRNGIVFYHHFPCLYR